MLKFKSVKMIKLLLPVLFLLFTACATKINVEPEVVYTSETLKVLKFSDHVYQHISYLETESWGKVECNGMILTDGGESVVFDTTVDNDSSSELIAFIQDELKSRINAVVPTHFHNDNLGGLEAFHQRGIPSFAHDKTIALAAKTNENLIPENGFADSRIFDFGNKSAVAVYLGEGHSPDNIVAYFTDEKVLFGGCLVKAMNAGKGNLADANVAAWSKTMKTLKRHYGNAHLVIPGHGKAGGNELLEYTRQLFE